MYLIITIKMMKIILLIRDMLQIVVEINLIQLINLIKDLKISWILVQELEIINNMEILNRISNMGKKVRKERNLLFIIIKIYQVMGERTRLLKYNQKYQINNNYFINQWKR
jgi:hypothetical protein